MTSVATKIRFYTIYQLALFRRVISRDLRELIDTSRTRVISMRLFFSLAPTCARFLFPPAPPPPSFCRYILNRRTGPLISFYRCAGLEAAGAVMRFKCKTG